MAAPLPTAAAAPASTAARRRRQRLLTARAAPRAADLDTRLYLDSAAALPAPFVGPVAAAAVPGKGRGLVASRPLHAGQLLLATPPLALVEGDAGEAPEHEELVELLSASGATFSPWQAGWLRALASSPDGSGGAAGGEGLPPLQPPEGQASWGGERPGAPEAAGGRVPFGQLGISEEELWGKIVLNCFGEGSPDLPASLCARPRAPLASLLGLWGPFSLLNHSCCPNAVAYTLRGGWMVVRATRGVPAGGEATINYLGRGALRPLAQRQQELEACYGFACHCERCQQEAEAQALPTRSGSTLGALLQQLEEDVWRDYAPALHQWDPDEQAGGQASSRKALLPLVRRMQEQWRDLQSATAGGGSSCAAQQVWAEAAAYDLLGLLQDALVAAGEPDDGEERAAVAAALLRVCREVCPGSDLHLFREVRQCSQDELRRHGRRPPAQALSQALAVRYGPGIAEDPGLLREMAEAAREAAGMVQL